MENKLNEFEGKEILKSDEAAKLLGITKGSLYYLTHHKKLTYFKPGGKINYFYKSELIKWIEKGRVGEIDKMQNEI